MMRRRRTRGRHECQYGSPRMRRCCRWMVRVSAAIKVVLSKSLVRQPASPKDISMSCFKTILLLAITASLISGCKPTAAPTGSSPPGTDPSETVTAPRVAPEPDDAGSVKYHYLLCHVLCFADDSIDPVASDDAKAACVTTNAIRSQSAVDCDYMSFLRDCLWFRGLL